MEKQQTASRVIHAPTADIFNLLTNPDRHASFDGSGFVRSSSKGDRLEKVGQQFRMNMVGDHMGGEYQTDNHVVGYIENQLIAWTTAPAGTEPPGWEWVYELKSEGTDATHVTLTFDWSNVTDPDILKQVHFPLISSEQMDDSLARLAQVANG